MTPKTNLLLLTVFGIFLLTSLNYSCTKEPSEELEVTGDYCTFRDGLNGPVSSQVSIAHDSTERFDYIISNISGYQNSSQAFIDIGCERVLDRLVILEYTVALGPNIMTVSGDGDIMDDGSIHFNIIITQDSETVYDLFMNSDASANFGTYSDQTNSLTIEESEITFAVSVNDTPYNFKISAIDNNGCGIIIPRQSTINLENDMSFEIESELFYTGDSLVGELRISSDNWQNVDTVELELQ